LPPPPPVAIGYQACSFQTKSGCFGDRKCPAPAATQNLEYPSHYTNYGVLALLHTTFEILIEYRILVDDPGAAPGNFLCNGNIA